MANRSEVNLAQFYADDLLPEMQEVLAALADIEVRHATERDRLEQWCGPEIIRERLAKVLETRRQRQRKLLVLRLADFRERSQLLIQPLRRVPLH